MEPENIKSLALHAMISLILLAFADAAIVLFLLILVFIQGLMGLCNKKKTTSRKRNGLNICKIIKGFFNSGNNRLEVFRKTDVLRNLTKFTGKHLCQSLFLNKVAGLEASNFIRLWHRCFPMNFVKFLRTPFFIEHLWWLLL